ncbi:uncharacterized protein LOC144134692 [Amblyomma americanum]
MKASAMTCALGVSFLVLFAVPAAPHTQRRAKTAASDGWQQMHAGVTKPKFARLADLAVQKFTTGVEFYHIVNKLLKVEKKGNQYRLTFLYVPTRCLVVDVFEPDRCQAAGAKPTGQCQTVVTIKKNRPSVDWIDCENFDKKAAVERASKMNNSARSR